MKTDETIPRHLVWKWSRRLLPVWCRRRRAGHHSLILITARQVLDVLLDQQVGLNIGEDTNRSALVVLLWLSFLFMSVSSALCWYSATVSWHFSRSGQKRPFHDWTVNRPEKPAQQSPESGSKAIPGFSSYTCTPLQKHMHKASSEEVSRGALSPASR